MSLFLIAGGNVRIAFDSSVAIPSLFPEGAPPIHECTTMLQRCLAGDTTILIPTPVLAECTRGAKRNAPRNAGIVVADFDEPAAMWLASSSLPRTGATKQVWKIDCLIVATAVRHRAQALISLDEDDHPKICKAAGIRCVTPAEFLTGVALV